MACCVIVVWSQHSVNSRWVKTEAAEGERRHMLIPVLLDEVRIPLEFRRIQAARLLDWHDTGPHPEFDKVVRAVTHLPLRPPSLTAEETLEAEAAPPIRPPPNPASPGVTSRLALRPQPQGRGQQHPRSTRKTSQRYSAIRLAPLVRQPGCLIAKSAVSCWLEECSYVCWSRRCISRSRGGLQDHNRNQGLVRPDPGSNQPTSPLTNSLGMEFVLIPAGDVSDGLERRRSDDEKPVHTVRISKPFYLGQYEVTQGQWEAVMGNNPSQFKGDPNRPVETVSWEEVQEFIRRLNAKEGGAQYRLPTEAEWEYAARAGSTTAYSFGDDASQLGKYAWYGDNAGDTTHPVGQTAAECLGAVRYAWQRLGVGAGLVWHVTAEPVTDPQGPASGSARVVRGGSWNAGAGTAGRRIATTTPPATATASSASAC